MGCVVTTQALKSFIPDALELGAYAINLSQRFPTEHHHFSFCW